MELVKEQRTNGSGLITEAEGKLTLEDVETIKNTIFKGCQESELKLFLHDCQRQGIHPLDRLIHPTIRNNKDGSRTYTAITSIDLFRARAEDSGAYAGNDEPVFSGDPKTEGFHATVTVYKIVQGIRCPFTATARWTEYKPTSERNQDFMWQSKPHVMLGKCAEALALRKAFPRQLAKLYTHEEMAQAGQEQPTDEQKPKAKPPVPQGERLQTRKLAPSESKLHPTPEAADGSGDRVPAEVTNATVQAAPEPIVVPDDGMMVATIVAVSKARNAKSNTYGILVNENGHKAGCKGNAATRTPCSCGGDYWVNTFHDSPWEEAKNLRGRRGVFTMKTNDNGFTNVEQLVGE